MSLQIFFKNVQWDLQTDIEMFIQAEDIKTALLSAKQNRKTPTVIEFIIDRERNVMPIVPPGNSLTDMILENYETVKKRTC